MTDVRLYTREDCPLCDKAKDAIRAAAAMRRLDVKLTEVDIDDDPALRGLFTNDGPVIYVDGAEASRHRATPEEFAAVVAGDRPPASSPLARETCEPCHGGTPRLTPDQIAALQRQISDDWHVIDGHHLRRELRFPDFRRALACVNRIGAIAEQQGHHPDIELGWGKAAVTIWTHAVDGLTRADFVLAARVDGACSGFGVRGSGKGDS